MDREEGLGILGRVGWLATTPADFRTAVLGCCRLRHYEAGAAITAGGDENGDLIGIVDGIVAMTTVLGVADTPIMHFAHPVLWFGYGPALRRQPRRVAASARTSVWVGRAPQAEIAELLAEQPQWWAHMQPLSLSYGDAVLAITADLVIRGSDRRCASVLLRLAGRSSNESRITGPVEVPVTQDELAACANVSVNTARAVLRKLAARDLIDLGYRVITLRAPGALRAYVDEG